MKESGNAALAQVKENQKQLLYDCQMAARHEQRVDSFIAPTESGHGRIEHRQCHVFECEFTTDPEWKPLVAQIVQLRRIRECRDTRTKQWKRSEETAFYVSTDKRSAAQYHQAARGHWGVENRNHHVRDVTFAEDASRIRKNPIVVAICRSFALNILRANAQTNIAHALYQNALDFSKITKLRFL